SAGATDQQDPRPGVTSRVSCVLTLDSLRQTNILGSDQPTLQAYQKILQTLQSLSDLLLRGGVGNPHVLPAAESRTRHQSYLSLVQQTCSQSCGVSDAILLQIRRDIGIHIKCALR